MNNENTISIAVWTARSKELLQKVSGILKEIGIENAKTALRKLRLIINIIDSSEKTIDCALNSDFADFEDAIQCYTAQNHQISTIITRNIKDYKTAGILVQTPEIFLCSQNMI